MFGGSCGELGEGMGRYDPYILYTCMDFSENKPIERVYLNYWKLLPSRTEGSKSRSSG